MHEPPETIYRNARIITLDPGRPQGRALAARQGRIVAVGDEDEILSLAGARTRILDLDGRTIVPGFIDAHSHFVHAGLYDLYLVDLRSPPLGDVTCIGDLVSKLREAARSRPESAWVMGYGYDDTLLEENCHPIANDLDRASTAHPILINHISGHLAVLNSTALTLTGINQSTPDPFGGKIRREAGSAAPNGVLDGEPAIHLAQSKLPKWEEGHWLKAAENASKMYAAKGVTSAQEGDAEPGDYPTLLAAHDKGLLAVRVSLYPNWDSLGELSGYPGPACGTAITADRMLMVGGVKMYQDGSIQGYSGYLSRPYHKQLYAQEEGAGYRGRPRNTRSELKAKIAEAHRDGWQVAVHANGDQAIEDVIDAMEYAQQRHPRKDARHIIIHCQTVREEQLDRMQALGIVPSFFTTHVYFWGDRHADMFLGPDRAGRLDPCGSAMARGMPFTCHNDTYVTPIDPLLSVWAAVNRITRQGRVLGPEFRVPVVEALRSVTIHAACQHHEEHRKGTLTPGKLADMTVLEENPFEIDPVKIKDIQVSATIVGDKVVHGGV